MSRAGSRADHNSVQLYSGFSTITTIKNAGGRGGGKEVSRLTALDLSSKLGLNACLDISLAIFVSLLITTFWENSQVMYKWSWSSEKGKHFLVKRLMISKFFFFAKFKMENKFKF